MSTHYTATVEVHKTVSTPAKTSYGREDAPASREVSEVVRLVVRADTLDALRDKLGAHVALVSE